MRLVHQYLQESGRRQPDSIAVVCNGLKLTYGELLERIEALAGMCIVEGLQKGDRVLILLRNQAECLLSSLAVMRAGGIAVPLVGLAAAEIEEIAGECDPFMLIAGKEELTECAVLRDRLRCQFLLFDGGSFSRLGSPPTFGIKMGDSMNADRIIQLMDLREEDGAIILYGLGPDGKRNGVLFNHHNVTQTSCNIDSVTRTDSSTRECVLVPMTESFGFMRICSLLCAGATVVLAKRSGDAGVVTRGIVKWKCNTLSADVATMFTLVDEIHLRMNECGSQLTAIHLGGNAVPFLFKKKKLVQAFPNAGIYMHYGTAEAPCTTCIEFHTEKAKLDSIGQPTPHTEISLIDDRGRLVNSEEIGEILVRGDQVMQRYWHRVELNRQVFFNDGWLRSGVIGYRDRDGYVHFLGLKNEIINAAGLVISPFEIEEAIHETYPDCEICVVGIPDPSVEVGDIPVLCYRSNGGQTIIPADLLTSLAYRLDKGKIPRIVYRMEHIPRSADKIERHELRKRILEGIAPSVPNTM